MNGILNSTALSRTSEIVKLATAKSASCRINSPIIPFQLPFASRISKMIYLNIAIYNNKAHFTFCSKLVVFYHS